MMKNNKINKNKVNKESGVGLMNNGIDYTTYTMKPVDIILAFLIGGAIGFLAMYLVVHNLKLSLVAAVIGGVVMRKPYRNSCICKRKKELLLQFRDLMESLVSSYSAGSNPQDAFSKAYDDMINLFGAGSYVAKEVYQINAGLKNGYTIEALLYDFANRAKLEDITSFVEVFNISFKKGGDMRKVLFDTRLVISEKIEMEQEMKVQLRGSVNELNVLIAVPVVIDFMMNGGDLNGDAATGLLARLIAVVMFVSAYAMGRYMLKRNESII